MMIKSSLCALGLVAVLLAPAASSSAKNGGTDKAPTGQAVKNEPNILSRDRVLRDPDVPVLGNPSGDLTIVEYFDYQCPICKAVHPTLAKVVREDGKIRIVSKSWPIFGPASSYAARMVLASKFQGKYASAHEALFTAKRPLNDEVIRSLLADAGVDVPRAQRDLAEHRDNIDATVKRNETEAQAFGFLGTPAFIIVTFRIGQGLDEANFKAAIRDARAAQPK